MTENLPPLPSEETDIPDRRDVLRAILGLVRGDGLDADVDAVPARWSVAGAHEFTIPGAPRRKLKARFRAAVGPIEDVEADLLARMRGPEGVGRPEVKEFAKRFKAACLQSGRLMEAAARIEEWIASVEDRAEAFGDAWKPQDFAAELTQIKSLTPDVIYLGGLTPIRVRIRAQMDKLGLNNVLLHVTSGIKSDA